MPIIEVNGIKLHYHVKGKGMPIIFVHPPLLTMENFNYQIAQLSDLFQVITFDMRGHGHSEPSDQPLTYPLIVEDMLRLLDALGVSECYVCGYSTGGSIALEAMLSYPGRFIGGIVISGMSEMTDWYNIARLGLAVGMSSIRAKKLLSAAICYGNSDMSQTYMNLYRGAIHGNVYNMKQYYAYSMKYNCTAKLKRIKQPVLLLYGQKNKSFYRYAELLQRELPNASLHFLSGVSHQLPTKAPNRVNRLIRTWVQAQEQQRDAGIQVPMAGVFSGAIKQDEQVFFT